MRLDFHTSLRVTLRDEFTGRFSSLLRFPQYFTRAMFGVARNDTETSMWKQTTKNIENHPQHKKASNLELHVMRAASLSENESGVQIFLHQRSFLNAGHELVIYSLLGRFLVLRALRREVGIVDGELQGGDVQLGAGGNHSGLSHTQQRNFVHALRS